MLATAVTDERCREALGFKLGNLPEAYSCFTRCLNCDSVVVCDALAKSAGTVLLM